MYTYRYRGYNEGPPSDVCWLIKSDEAYEYYNDKYHKPYLLRLWSPT